MADTNFHELMANTLHNNFNIAGKTVLEIASDPWLIAAKRFVKLGARRVIASDLSTGWAQESDPSIEVAVIDARKIDEALGENAVDAVMGINLLEHLQDISIAVRSIWRVLRPGGFCLLHGHPIWTLSRGHHVMLGYIGATVNFSGPTNPIPLWGHLFMSETEMRRELAAAGHPPAVIEASANWAFHNDAITRLPRRRIIEQVKDSPFRVSGLWEDRLEPAGEVDLIRIRQGPWWDPEEDYGVRGMTFLLRKD